MSHASGLQPTHNPRQPSQAPTCKLTCSWRGGSETCPCPCRRPVFRAERSVRSASDMVPLLTSRYSPSKAPREREMAACSRALTWGHRATQVTSLHTVMQTRRIRQETYAMVQQSAYCQTACGDVQAPLRAAG